MRSVDNDSNRYSYCIGHTLRVHVPNNWAFGICYKGCSAGLGVCILILESLLPNNYVYDDWVLGPLGIGSKCALR